MKTQTNKKGAQIVTNKKGMYLVTTNKEKIKAEKSNPYMKGYFHALKKGIKNNTYSLDAYRYLYNMGYDAGMTTYCMINHPEEF